MFIKSCLAIISSCKWSLSWDIFVIVNVVHCVEWKAVAVFRSRIGVPVTWKRNKTWIAQLFIKGQLCLYSVWRTTKTNKMKAVKRLIENVNWKKCFKLTIRNWVGKQNNVNWWRIKNERQLTHYLVANQIFKLTSMLVFKVGKSESEDKWLIIFF
jgi:hypothetical protein